MSLASSPMLLVSELLSPKPKSLGSLIAPACLEHETPKLPVGQAMSCIVKLGDPHIADHPILVELGDLVWKLCQKSRGEGWAGRW